MVLLMKTTRQNGGKRNPGNGNLQLRFGRRVHAWRKERGLPLKSVAHDLKLSVAIVSQWENGLRFPSLQNLLRLATYTGIAPCCLLFDGKEDCPHHG